MLPRFDPASSMPGHQAQEVNVGEEPGSAPLREEPRTEKSSSNIT